MLNAGTAARRRSLTWTSAQTPEQVRLQIETLLRAIDARLSAAAPDWVGHTKILVADDAQSAYGSITAAGDAPQWAGRLSRPLRQAEMTIYAAIYGLNDAQVAQAVDQALQALPVEHLAAERAER